MDAKARTRQAQACHIKFKQLAADGIIPASFTVYDYACQVLARRVASLKDLQDWELNALRDRLEGKENKGLAKVRETAAAAGIGDLGVWMKNASKRDAFAYLRGYTPETLPAPLQWRLANCLQTRERKKISAPRESGALLFD